MAVRRFLDVFASDTLWLSLRRTRAPFMATLDIPNRYLALAPIVVTSPTTRCGTTLVQRLLTATDNCFVYGEEIGNHVRALTHVFIAQVGHLETNGAAVDEAFIQALTRTLDRWQPGLGPPANVMLHIWTETYYQLPANLAAFGRTLDRPLWGFKWPGYARHELRLLRLLMPQTRVIYVTRNVVDALQSAKARKFVVTEPEAERFCTEWASNMTAFAEDGAEERTLHLRYEILIGQCEAQIAALAAFTGALSIQSSELEVKLNTFVGEASDGHSATQYIAPEALSAREWAIVGERAGGAMARHYPEIDLRAAI